MTILFTPHRRGNTRHRGKEVFSLTGWKTTVFRRLVSRFVKKSGGFEGFSPRLNSTARYQDEIGD